MLLNPDQGLVEYSIFRMSGFNVLQAGLHRLNELSRGTPVYSRLIQESALEKEHALGNVYRVR